MTWIDTHRTKEIDKIKECQEVLRVGKVGKNNVPEMLHTRQIEEFEIGGRWKTLKGSVVEFLRYQ